MSGRDDFSVESARAAAQADELGDWVSRFLASPGSDNAALADKLADQPRWWFGPVQLPLDQLQRLAGPPDAPVLCAVTDEYWGDDVDEMHELIDDGWEPPPVIVSTHDGQLLLEDGNHRVESLRRSGVRRTWAVVSFESPEARDAFARLRGS
jgi:hypothetical protein